MTITPGDLLHGDLNGVATIPEAVAGNVVAKSKEILDNEQKKVDFIKSTEFTLDGLAKRSNW